MADKAFGWHLMLDLYGCDSNLIKNKKSVKDFSYKLCKLIEMKIFGQPIIKKFGKPGTTAEGFTLVQLIETSALVAHFSDKTKNVYMDLFSCKLFDPKKVNEFTSEYFKSKKFKSKFTIRK